MAGLAVAAILKSEATNKMKLFRGSSDFFKILIMWIFLHSEKNIKISEWSQAQEALPDSNMAQKWSDFDETWYLWSALFKPKTLQIFLRSDNFWIPNSSATNIENCPISIKFGAFLVWSVLITNTKFRQNRTIFGPYLCQGAPPGLGSTLKFWYFFHYTKIFTW